VSGQSANMTISEVCSTIKKLEENQHTNGNGSCSGSERNQQNGVTGRQPAKKA